MRHRKRRTRFGRQMSHRIATLKGLTRSLIMHYRIKTTHTKAKEAKRVAERLITLAKRAKNPLSARRKAFSMLGDRTLVTKLFKEIAPLFAGKNGGYTRIIPFNFRKGDGASMVLLELTNKPEEKPKPAKKAKISEKEAKPKEAKPEPPRAAPGVEPKIKEEKTVEQIKREKAKDEAKKIEKQKSFLKKVRGFFRRKTNM